jgi:hypothetical protein
MIFIPLAKYVYILFIDKEDRMVSKLWNRCILLKYHIFYKNLLDLPQERFETGAYTTGDKQPCFKKW